MGKKLSVVKVSVAAGQLFALALTGKESKEEILQRILSGDALQLGDTSSLNEADVDDVEVTEEVYDLEEG